MSRQHAHEHPLQTMHFRSLGFRTLVLAAAISATACFSDQVAPSSSPPPPGACGADATARGCAVAGGTTPPMAPNGYYTNGATVCTSDGQAHLFHGVDRPSFEWNPDGESFSPQDFGVMASWHANVVRIALNQDFWISGAALYDADYEDNVKTAVSWAEAAGLDVILDLHWSDRGDLTVPLAGGSTKQDANGGSNQQQMADQNSIQFWTEVATDFQDDGHVLFELYNEPNGIPWSVWLNGGESTGFLVAGMQQLYQAVRATGAQNVVIAGGLDWAFDLSGVRSNPIVGYNVMYATHPYDKSDNQPGAWENSFGYLATNNIAPVIATEFGDGRTACTGAWDTEFTTFADAHQMSWTAWAWYPAGCSFPALISDWSYTLTVQGQVVFNVLGSYPQPTPSAMDGGAEAGTEAGAESLDATMLEAGALTTTAGDDAAPDAGSDASATGVDAVATTSEASTPLDDAPSGDDAVADDGAPDFDAGDASDATVIAPL